MAKSISRFQYITQDHSKYSHEEQVKMVASSGCNWIQLRMKDIPESLYLTTAKNCVAIAHEHGAKLIINGNVHIAQDSNADGINLGVTDLPTSDARKIFGDNFIIGGMANELEDVIYHEPHCDYVEVGAYQSNSIKKNFSSILGAGGFKELYDELAKRNISIPMIATGGIGFIDTAFLAPTGVHGIAVSGGLINAEDIPLEIKKFNAAIVSGWGV